MAGETKTGAEKTAATGEKTKPVRKSDEDWKSCLLPEQYRVLRKKGTEMPFSGKLLYNKEKGMYVCAACGNPLFPSDTKFESGTGWPSFWNPATSKSVKLQTDWSAGIPQTEVVCAKCGSHLGHVFNDAPQTPTGKRYCINSVSLEFKNKPGEKPGAKEEKK